MKKMKMDYPQKKEIRKHIEEVYDNVYELAEKFGCSTSQVAGVKSTLNRG